MPLVRFSGSTKTEEIGLQTSPSSGAQGRFHPLSFQPAGRRSPKESVGKTTRADCSGVSEFVDSQRRRSLIAATLDGFHKDFLFRLLRGLI